MIARHDFETIAQWVAPNSRVLDLGCGDGTLLRHLKETRNALGYGIENADANILACMRNGINVIQMNLEEGLSGFEPGSFDYVILSQTLQAMRHTEQAIREMLRVGKQGIVAFPNFGHWSNRWQIANGRMPVTPNLPYQWFDTPNIHLCTLEDFEAFCRDHGVRILERIVMHDGRVVSFLPNLLGSLAVYRFEKA